MLVQAELPKVVRHPSAEAILIEFWRKPSSEGLEGVGSDDQVRSFLREGEFGNLIQGVDGAITEEHQSFEDQVQQTQDEDCWGYFDTPANTIHYWADPKATLEWRLMLFSHELGHMVSDKLKPELGAPPPGPGSDAAQLQDEMVAEWFSWVAIRAYEFAVASVGGDKS